MKIRAVVLAAAAACALAISGPAVAQYPDEDIEILVGFSAGGGTDVLARTFASYLERHLGSTVVVRNVPGASGQIGLTQTALADPDGYTLGTFNLPGSMSRTVDREADYDADSFTYLANLVFDPSVIVTPKDGIDNVEALMTRSVEDPGALTVSMSSLGGDDHFMLMKMEKLGGGSFTIVPFNGSAPARTALMGGHVDLGLINLSEALGFQDQINILGVAQEERSSMAPDIPTFREQGYDLVNGGLRGIVAPAGLPEDVEATLRAAIDAVFADPDFLAAMSETGNPARLIEGEDFRQVSLDQLELAREVWAQTPWR